MEISGQEGGRLRGGKRWGGRGPCAIRSCLCLSVCLFSHSRNQFAIRTVTVEQREKEACQVGHTQREMEKDKTGTRRQGRDLERRRWGHKNLRCPTYSYNSKHTCRDQEDWTSNSLINTFLNPDMFAGLTLSPIASSFIEYLPPSVTGK